TKVTSGYRGAAQGDRLAVVTSEGMDVTEWLRARVVDCSNFGNLSLSFYLDYQAGSGDGWGRVMWSNWSTFPSFTLLDQFTTDTLGWQTYDLSVLDGEHHGYLAFVYHGTDDLYMAVDDVTLAGDKMAYDAGMHSDANRYFRAPDDYDKAQLEFQYWLESQQGMDMLQVTYYTLATRQWVTLWSISGGAGQWRTGRVDLPINASAIGFVFMSAGVGSAEGAYVDDVRVTATEDLDNVSIKVGDGGWTDVGNVTDWSYTWDTTEVTSSEMVEVTVRATYGMWEAFDTLYLGVDRLLPWFGADTSPDKAETDLSYTFSVSVEDNVGVGVVWVEYWYGDGEPTRMNMTLASDTAWEHWMVVNATLEDLHYVLGCSDLAGNVNTTGVRTVDVVDINGPVIINEGTGRTATTGDPFEFTVTVGDNVGVKGATVWFAFGDGELEPVAMEVVSEWPSGNVLFSLVMDVPANATGNITYRLEVEDLYGNVQTTNIEYVRVVDDDLPVIVEDRTPQEAYTGETFTFNVTVTDNVGIASVEVTYHMPDVNRWTVTMDQEGDVYTYSL
ncbi:MAG: hypothetical protein KAS77_11230, partial [Thermoplasmata archaeon]|nr:hypothetical protein [Thermoplasmata archaeon]